MVGIGELIDRRLRNLQALARVQFLVLDLMLVAEGCRNLEHYVEEVSFNHVVEALLAVKLLPKVFQDLLKEVIVRIAGCNYDSLWDPHL